MANHSKYRGSSFAVIFDHQLSQVLIGYSSHDKRWKFFGGTMDQVDDAPARDEVAYKCVKREVLGEVGVSSSRFEFLTQLGSPHEYHARDKEKEGVIDLCQYTYVAMVKEGTELPDQVAEADEMVERQFASIFQVLDNCFSARDCQRKFIPAHGIGLVRVLLFLRDMRDEADDQVLFRSFSDTLTHLEMNGVRLDTHEAELRGAMDRREI